MDCVRVGAGAVALVCTVALIATTPVDAGAVAGAGQPRLPVDGTAQPAFAPSAAAAARFHAQPHARGRLLVAPAARATAKGFRATHRRLGARVDRVLPGTGVREVRLPGGLSVAEAAARYERSPDVRFAEPDYLVRPTAVPPVRPDDPGFGLLYGLHNTGQTGGTRDADIDMPEAWALTTGGADPVVAVIDTGVDITHPDLARNIWTNPGEQPANGRDDDGNGYVDDVHGWDFFHDDNTVYDSATHVAGTIAARGNNRTGATGVAWRSRLMPLKFLGAGGVGYVSDAIAALDYAVANGARISNSSWGGPDRSQALEEAIERAEAAGHLVVAAAGNSGQDADVHPTYPAAYDGSNIVSVAASDDRDRLAPYSNVGRRSVDLAAPGDRIYSTLPGNRYGYASGTSMATPHVTGAAALLWARRPASSMPTVRNRLIRRVDRKPSFAATAGRGRLNVRRALGPPTRARLSLTRTRGVVTHGSTTTLRGRLTLGGEPLARRRVVLQQRPVSTHRWRPVPGGVRVTAQDGTFRQAGLRPRRHTDYRARFAGEAPSVTGAWSPTRRTRVRTRVTIAVSRRSLALGATRVVRGAVLPAHRGAVGLVVARNGEVVRRTRLGLTDSRYRFRFRPGRAGRFTVYVVRPADRDHLRGRSPARSFRVVR